MPTSFNLRPFRRLLWAACFLLPMGTALADTIQILPLRGRVTLDRGGERPETLEEASDWAIGQVLRTSLASGAVLFFADGTRIAVLSESSLVWTGRGAGGAPRIELRGGMLVGQVPARGGESGAARVAISTLAGVVEAQAGAFVTSVLDDHSGRPAQIIGAESGRVRFVPHRASELGPRIVHAGDALTVTRIPSSEVEPAPQIQEQLFVGDMRVRLISGLEDLQQAQARLTGTTLRERATRAPSNLPPSDRLPRPFPVAGAPPPDAL